MPWDPDTAIGGPQDRFPSTRHSLFEAAASSGGDPLPGDALDSVVALYWKPIYKYIRLKWRKDNEEAKDLTQSFFASALERDFFQRFDPQRASFRTYLRMAVDRFAANQQSAAGRQKRGGGSPAIALDFAGADREAALCGSAPSPEEAFQREWQRQLFSLALEDLCARCHTTGKLLQFQVFADYDLADGARPSYAELAQRHGIPLTAVTNYLAWSRRMLRTMLVDRLCGVTSGDRELRDELRRALDPVR